MRCGFRSGLMIAGVTRVELKSGVSPLIPTFRTSWADSSWDARCQEHPGIYSRRNEDIVKASPQRPGLARTPTLSIGPHANPDGGGGNRVRV